MYYVVVSLNKGPQYGAQYTIILIIGPSIMVPLILGNPHVCIGTKAALGFGGLQALRLGLYWGYIGMMENKMETTIIGYYIGVILGLYRDNGK